MSGTEKWFPKTWKKELDGLKAESTKTRHDLVENDTILGELAEIADKAAMVQRARVKQNETRSDFGAEKSREGVSGQKRKHEEEIS